MPGRGAASIQGSSKKRAAAARVNLLAGNNVGYFGPYEGLLRGSTARGHSGGCGAGRNSIGIEADGTIKGCPSLATRSWSGGNVRDTPLAEIWKRATPLRYTRDRTAKDLWGYCATCYYADTCRAGCTWTADVLFGRPGNNPYCHHRALTRKREGLRERLVLTTRAAGEPFDHGIFTLLEEPAHATWPEADALRFTATQIQRARPADTPARTFSILS